MSEVYIVKYYVSDYDSSYSENIKAFLNLGEAEDHISNLTALEAIKRVKRKEIDKERQNLWKNYQTAYDKIFKRSAKKNVRPENDPTFAPISAKFTFDIEENRIKLFNLGDFYDTERGSFEIETLEIQ